MGPPRLTGSIGLWALAELCKAQIRVFLLVLCAAHAVGCSDGSFDDDDIVIDVDDDDSTSADDDDSSDDDDSGVVDDDDDDAGTPPVGDLWLAGGQLGARLGEAVDLAGDVNGDGFSDVVAGAPTMFVDDNSQGAAFVLWGNSSSASLETTRFNASSGALFGSSVSGAGDVNGDGFDDVIVGAPFHENGEAFEGAAFLFLGSSIGLETTAAWEVEANAVSHEMGNAVEGAGDVNGDGFDDVLIAASGFDDGLQDLGIVYLYFGSPTGPASSADWSYQGVEVAGAIGMAISGSGDVNGDNFSDFVVASPFAGSASGGAAHVFLGSPSLPDPVPDWSIEGTTPGQGLGASVSLDSDFNGDGYSDLLVGSSAPDEEGLGPGEVRLYFGSALGLSSSPDWAAASGVDAVLALGLAVAGVQDTNGDGLADILLGLPNYSFQYPRAPTVSVYYGAGSLPAATPDWNQALEQDASWFGGAIGSAGDFNGDGVGDLVVGAKYYSGTHSLEGGLFIFLGPF